MSRILITIVFISIFFSQSKGSISGIVSDKQSKEKLIGVNISVLGTNLGTTTDINGRFRLENLENASYKLQFEYLGYQAYIQTDIIVKPARETELNIQLIEDVFSGDIVEVRASFYQSALIEPIRVVSFSPEEIRRSPGAGGELSRILGAMPSVTSRGEDSQDIIVRGGSPLENFFLIDNIPVPSIRHFETATGHSNGPIGLINTALVNDVKFSAGGFAAHYGGYLSSATDIQYKEGSRESLNGELGIDFTGFNGIIEGPFAGKKGSFLLSARRSYLDIVADAIGESGAPQFEDAQTKIVYDINDNSKLSLLGIYGRSAFDATDLEKALEDDQNDLIRAENDQFTIGMNWRQFWNKTAYSNTSISYSKRLFLLDLKEFDLSQSTKNDDIYREWNFRHQTSLELAKGHQLILGADAKHELADFNYFYAASTLPTGEFQPDLARLDEVTADQFGLSVSLNSRLSHRIGFQAGIRADYNSFNDDYEFGPRLNVSFQLNEKMSLNAAYGKTFQRIPLFIASQLSDLSNIKAMSAEQFIFGWDYLLTADTKLSIETFYKQYGQMPLNPANDPAFAPIYPMDVRFGQLFTSIQSNGEAESYGVEFLIQKKLAVNFYGLISASYFRSLYKDQFANWQNRTFDNRFLFNIIGGYKPNDTWEYSVRWSLIGGKPNTPIDKQASIAADRQVFDMSRYNQDRLDPYHSLYIRVDRRFAFDASSMIIYLTVWNAYGNENVNGLFWNDTKDIIVKDKGFGTLPVLGVKYEF